MCTASIQTCARPSAGLVNEPDNSIPIAKLVSYYRDAYAAIRSAGMPPERVDVFFAAYQRDLSQFDSLGFPDASMQGAVLELHLYQCFGFTWLVTLCVHLFTTTVFSCCVPVILVACFLCPPSKWTDTFFPLFLSLLSARMVEFHA